MTISLPCCPTVSLAGAAPGRHGSCNSASRCDGDLSSNLPPYDYRVCHGSMRPRQHQKIINRTFDSKQNVAECQGQNTAKTLENFGVSLSLS